MGAPSGATYPGRVSTSTARTYTPGYSNAVPGTFNGGSRNGVRVAPTNPTFSDSTRVTGYSPRGNTNTGSGYHPNTPNGPVYVNGNNGYRNNGYYNNGYRNNGYYSNNVRQNCAPRYSNYYDPYLYSDYNCRRGYRYYNNYYSVPFLSLGYFVARPYNYYNYASIDYAQPFVYGEDVDYRQAAPAVQEVASVQQTAAPSSLEQDLLNELARYVNANSKNDRFQIADPAFGDQVWSLDLTQAPAVYSIDTNHYSVVAGFEGTLGANTIPSSVGLEFFVAREASKWSIKKAWIVSANGIPRAKRFRSPAYPQVQTWQAGQSCPFSGQPMVPITDATTP